MQSGLLKRKYTKSKNGSSTVKNEDTYHFWRLLGALRLFSYCVYGNVILNVCTCMCRGHSRLLIDREYNVAKAIHGFVFKTVCVENGYLARPKLDRDFNFSKLRVDNTKPYIACIIFLV